MAVKYEIFFAVFCLVAVLAVGGRCGPDENSFCANPILENDNIVDLPYILEHYKQGWNCQFGNSLLRQRLARLLHGNSSLQEDIDYSNMCLRLNFKSLNANGLFGSLTGFSYLSARWNCTESSRHIYDCSFYSNRNEYKDHAIVYVVYFDGNENHNMAGLAYCFDDGAVGWFGMSLSKTLSEVESRTLINRFRSVGFNPDLRVPLRSETCR